MNGQTKTVLVRGIANELAEPVVAALLARGATVALHEPLQPARAAALKETLAAQGLPGRIVDLTSQAPAADATAAPFEALQALGLGLDGAVHLHLPDLQTDEAALQAYTGQVRAMTYAAVDHMKRIGSTGIVVNQFLMATLFAGAPIAAPFMETRMSMTAIVRNACLAGGKSGVRALGLMVGLLDLPQLRALASERVNAAKTPLGRWLRADEVAQTIAFLVQDSGYITGQMLVMDGGMTSGINGV